MSTVHSSGFRADRVRKYLSELFLALCVIGVGIGYLGNIIPFLPWTNFTIFFPGWGALFLIIPGIWGLIRHPFSWFWILCVLGGTLIILNYLDLYPMKVCVAIVLAIFLILIGIRILLAPLFRRLRRKRAARFVHETVSEALGGADGDGAILTGNGSGEYGVTFGSRTIDMTGQSFTAATLNCSFGELTFDLRGALVQDNSVIDINNSFGQTNVLLPDDVKVELSRGVSFASVNNRHKNPKDEHAPVLYINASCSFGEIDIR